MEWQTRYLVLALIGLFNFCHAQQEGYGYANEVHAFTERSENQNEHSFWYSQSEAFDKENSSLNGDAAADRERKSTPANNGMEGGSSKRSDEQNQFNVSSGNEDKSTPSADALKEADKQKPQEIHTFSASVSLVSDYRFRGISQTMRRPAIQGTFDYKHKGGAYIGIFGSNVDGTSNFYNNTSLELDFYGGYKNKLGACFLPDLEYNVGAIYYYYAGGKVRDPHNTRYNMAELFIELSYKWLSIKYSQNITNYLGINANNTPFNWEKNKATRPNKSSRGSNNVEASATFDLVDKSNFEGYELGKLNLALDVGHQTVRHYGQLSCTHWRATLTQEFAWFNLFLSYVGTDANQDYFDVPDVGFYPRKHALGAQGVVVGIVKSF